MSKYSLKQKQEVIRLIIEEKVSAASAAQSIGASKSDAQKWLKLYREYGVEGLQIKKETTMESLK